MRTLLVLSLALTAGCNAEIIVYGESHRSDGGGGGARDGGALGSDGGGGPSKLCPDGQHQDGVACVADEVACANEFPCPNGQTCTGGRCINVPGPCLSNDACPAGDACVNGQCTPTCAMGNPQCKLDADCGPAHLCIACLCVSVNACAKPTADLSGAPFTAHQVLHLDEALSAFGKGFVGVLKKLRDGIMGCPQGASGDCFLYQIIAGFLPDWAKTLVVAVGNFGDILDNHNFIVDSEMAFTKNGKPSGYSGVDHWKMLTFSYQNQVVMKAPENVAQIGKPVVVPFQASAVCGILYVDKHSVDGVLSGILKWIVDTVVELSTCNNPQAQACYHSLSDAITGAIDCNAIGNFAAQVACFAFTNGLGKKIDDLLNAWLLDYSLMTLTGTATVDPNGHALSDGKWDGTLGNGIAIFKDFTGEWSAAR